MPVRRPTWVLNGAEHADVLAIRRARGLWQVAGNMRRIPAGMPGVSASRTHAGAVGRPA
jgi:hypothetical protein